VPPADPAGLKIQKWAHGGLRSPTTRPRCRQDTPSGRQDCPRCSPRSPNCPKTHPETSQLDSNRFNTPQLYSTLGRSFPTRQSWGGIGALLGGLGAVLGHLGSVLSGLGRSLGGLGAILAGLGAVLGVSSFAEQGACGGEASLFIVFICCLYPMSCARWPRALSLLGLCPAGSVPSWALSRWLCLFLGFVVRAPPLLGLWAFSCGLCPFLRSLGAILGFLGGLGAGLLDPSWQLWGRSWGALGRQCF